MAGRAFSSRMRWAGVKPCRPPSGSPAGQCRSTRVGRIGVYALWPFGYTTVERHDAGAPSCVGNVLWLVLAGWWLAIGHIVTGLALCVTIIGIPFGIANFKLIPVSLFPLGREIVPTDRPFASTW
ncbi:YccF domain-containing protein [Streptomyces nigra]